MRWNVMGALALCLTAANQAAADVDSYCVYSLEWLTDASQSVQLATVVREQDSPETWTTRVKSVDRVLKAAAGDKSLPTAQDLSDAAKARGENRVLLFLRRVAGKRTPVVLYVVYLNVHVVPESPAARAAVYREVLPEGFERPQPTESSKCVAIDRTGRVLVDPEAVIKLVEERARQHPERIAAEGFIAPRGEALEDQNSVYVVYAPFDPEERGPFLKQLRGPDGVARATAAGHLAHYPDAEVIAALKKCLTDDYYNTQDVQDNPEGPSRSASIYIVRRAAYESLRRLTVEVPKPELEHHQ